MNVQELRKKLADLNVDPRAAGIEGVNLFDGQYRIEKRYEGYWIVHYFERGQAFSAREFATEERACEDFLKRITDDKSTRIQK